MKNKNGFTLIELLVAIAIMLSILGIAIISFIKVSDRKKEETWESVKKQVEVAAEEFFTYNEYLFEGLSDGAQAEISVGKLVAEDYLNKVTNPVTGKAVSECMIVKVTKINGSYKLAVDETTENSDDKICETGSSLTIREVGAPEISVEKKCGSDGKNGWCKKSSDGKGVIVTATASEAARVEYEVFNYIAGIWDPNGNIKNGKKYEDNVNTNGKSVCFLATGSNGAKSSSCVDYKIDMELPGGEIKIESVKGNLYNSKEVNITGKVYDNESGVAFVSSNPTVSFDSATGIISLNNHKLFNSFNAESKSIVLKVKDKAGNENDVKSNKYVVYKECDDTKYLETKEEIKTDCTGKCGGKKTTTVYDIYVDSVTEKVCNKDFVQNNEKDCDACPNLTCPTPKVLGTKGNNGWYKKGDVKYTEGGKNYYFALEIKPTSGTSYWNWYTGYKGESYTNWGKNEGVQTKTLGDGNRIAKVVIYDKYGNSKECTYEYNIDTEAPVVDLKEAYDEYYNLDKVRVGSSSTKDRSVSAMPNVKGNVLHCLDKGEVHTSGTSSLTCKGGSDYSVTDNISKKSEMNSSFYTKALTDTGDYCLFKDEGRCEASKIHPFPSKYYLCYTDLAGNTGCDTLNYILYNKAYAGVSSDKFTYGTKGSEYKKLYGWSTYEINKMWNLKGWETEKYLDFK